MFNDETRGTGQSRGIAAQLRGRRVRDRCNGGDSGEFGRERGRCEGTEDVHRCDFVLMALRLPVAEPTVIIRQIICIYIIIYFSSIKVYIFHQIETQSREARCK